MNSASTFDQRILLATAVVFVYLSTGGRHAAKTLIDLGSDNVAILGDLAKKLQMKESPDNSTMTGIGGASVSTQNATVTFRISSHVDETFSTEVTATLMHNITGKLPLVPIQREDWPHLRGIKLADPHYDCPSSVEILLGADVYE